MSDENVVRLAKEAVRIELEKLNALNVPIVEYDNASKKIILVFNDGTKTEADSAIFKERYSERSKKA